MTRSVWSRFGYKSVLELANVRPGEVFTVLTDDWANPEIAEAVFGAGLSQSDNTQLLRIRSYHSSEEPVMLNVAVTKAVKESDVVLSVCQTRIGQTAACREALAAGTRILLAEPGNRETFLLDGLLNLDYDQMLKNVGLFNDIMQEEGYCKVMSATGTDLEFKIGDRPTLLSPGKVSEPGDLDWYPGALSNVAPIEKTIHGVIAVDGSLFPFGAAEDNVVFIEIEEGTIKKIRGGNLAQHFKQWMESLNDTVVYRFCHFSVGFNPRAEMTGWTTEDERCLGAITIGFGRCYSDLKGTIKGGEHHVDVVLAPPTIQIGGKPVLEGGLFNTKLGFVNM